MSDAAELLGALNAFVDANFRWIFYLSSALILVGAALSGWATRKWLKQFDADDLHVPFKGPKPKLCPTINAKLDKIEKHKRTMLSSVATQALWLLVVGALIPSVLLALFVFYHDRLDLADGAFLQAETKKVVPDPTVDETISFVSSQLLRSGFDFAEVYASDDPEIVLDPSHAGATAVVLVFRTFVQVFAVGVPVFIALALWLRLTRTRQESDLHGRLSQSNCERTPQPS